MKSAQWPMNINDANKEGATIMGLFSNNNKLFEEMSDKELLRFIEHPPFGSSITTRGKAIEEAIRRGLTNPKTGEPFHY